MLVKIREAKFVIANMTHDSISWFIGTLPVHYSEFVACAELN